MNVLNGRMWTGAAAAAILTVSLGLHACGDDGGGSGSSQISGNVSGASTAARPANERSWLAWIGEEVLGFAKRAVAQVPGITVSAGSASDVTDETGAFDLPGAPTGDVTVSFEEDGCEAGATLPDVVAGSNIAMNDVSLNCNQVAGIGSLAEVFPAVVQNAPSSPNGNLNVCVNSGGRIRTRVVKMQSATIAGGSFEDLQRGTAITADGEREGLGTNSALDADTITITGQGSVEDCEGLPAETPTPTPTGTPEPTATATP